MRGESEDRAKVQIGLRPVERWKPEYRVRSTDYGGNVGAWLRRVLVCLGGQGEALPLPASVAREIQLGWHAVPTLPDAVEMGDRGAGSWRGGVDAELSNRQTLTAIRYLMYLIDSALRTPYSVLRALGRVRFYSTI